MIEVFNYLSKNIDSIANKAIISHLSCMSILLGKNIYLIMLISYFLYQKRISCKNSHSIIPCSAAIAADR